MRNRLYWNVQFKDVFQKADIVKLGNNKHVYSKLSTNNEKVKFVDLILIAMKL